MTEKYLADRPSHQEPATAETRLENERGFAWLWTAQHGQRQCPDSPRIRPDRAAAGVDADLGTIMREHLQRLEPLF